MIEVSESSLRKERGVKQRIYARNGTQDYWIINLVERVVEVYRKPQGERYASVQRFAPAKVSHRSRFPIWWFRWTECSEPQGFGVITKP